MNTTFGNKNTETLKSVYDNISIFVDIHMISNNVLLTPQDILNFESFCEWVKKNQIEWVFSESILQELQQKAQFLDQLEFDKNLAHSSYYERIAHHLTAADLRVSDDLLSKFSNEENYHSVHVKGNGYISECHHLIDSNAKGLPGEIFWKSTSNSHMQAPYHFYQVSQLTLMDESNLKYNRDKLNSVAALVDLNALVNNSFPSWYPLPLLFAPEETRMAASEEKDNLPFPSDALCQVLIDSIKSRYPFIADTIDQEAL